MSETLLDRIHLRLSEIGSTARRASINAGMGPDVIRDIERNPSKSVTLRTIEALAKSLDVNPEWLAFGTGDATNGRFGVPIVSWVSAGSFASGEPVTDFSDSPKIEVGELPPGDWFALTVDGDSMDRISPPGSIILVNRKDRKLVPNACYVIANEQGEATYKRYRASPDRFQAVSTNPEHEEIFPDGVVRVIGRVRRSIIEM